MEKVVAEQEIQMLGWDSLVGLFGLDWFGLGCLVWFGLVWLDLAWLGLAWLGWLVGWWVGRLVGWLCWLCWWVGVFEGCCVVRLVGGWLVLVVFLLVGCWFVCLG